MDERKTGPEVLLRAIKDIIKAVESGHGIKIAAVPAENGKHCSDYCEYYGCPVEQYPCCTCTRIMYDNYKPRS